MTNIAFIPARGGSKGIPKKNIKSFCGHPLIYWNLQELQYTELIDLVLVSTDSEEISSVVNSFNFSKVRVVNRSTETSSDTASTESAILEHLTSNPRYDPNDRFMLVQLTSPLTSREDFTNAFVQFGSGLFDSLVSVVKVKRFIWSNDGVPINYDIYKRPRRQEFNGYFTENGAFYLSTVHNILESKNRISGKICCYEMPTYSYFEIDEEDDWVIAESLMKRHFSHLNQTNEHLKNKIRLVATDVDGVLTDAGMYYSELGDELKKFNTRDGKGFELLRCKNIKTVILTSEHTKLLEKRGHKLNVDYLIQNVTGIGKLDALKNICQKENIPMDQCAYIGDDVNCLPLLMEVGFAFCPNDAEETVKQIDGVVCLSKNGGSGAFRELVNIITT